MNPVEIAALDALDLLVVVGSTRYPAWIKVCRSFPSSGDWSRVFPILRPRTAMTASSPGGICASPATASRRWSTR